MTEYVHICGGVFTSEDTHCPRCGQSVVKNKHDEAITVELNDILAILDRYAIEFDERGRKLDLITVIAQGVSVQSNPMAYVVANIEILQVLGLEDYQPRERPKKKEKGNETPDEP